MASSFSLLLWCRLSALKLERKKITYVNQQVKTGSKRQLFTFHKYLFKSNHYCWKQKLALVVPRRLIAWEDNEYFHTPHMVLAHVLLIQAGLYTIQWTKSGTRSILNHFGVSVTSSTGAGGLVSVLLSHYVPANSMIFVKNLRLFYFQNVLFAMLFSEIFSVSYQPESRRVNNCWSMAWKCLISFTFLLWFLNQDKCLSAIVATRKWT